LAVDSEGDVSLGRGILVWNMTRRLAKPLFINRWFSDRLQAASLGLVGCEDLYLQRQLVIRMCDEIGEGVAVCTSVPW
jgi:hypothetical protein